MILIHQLVIGEDFVHMMHRFGLKVMPQNVRLLEISEMDSIGMKSVRMVPDSYKG
jgi:hypothetical protein